MAAQLPTINVIRDTPTSPHHRPLPVYSSPGTIREDDSPEVDLSNRDVEGLQVDPDGPYPQPTTETDAKQNWWRVFDTSEKQVPHDDSGLISTEKSLRKEDRRVCGLKRRTFFITAAVIAIVVVAAAVGGGVGGCYASRPTATTTQSPTPTSPAVTSGTTGMAALPCQTADPAFPGAPPATPRNISNPYLTLGATFNITCRRGLPSTGDRNGNPISNLSRWTEYSITSCMSRCANDTSCAGIVYGANLTEMVATGDPGGNCLLKNATWEATSHQATWFASAVKI